MEKLIAGVKQFQEEVFPERQALFSELAEGQSPEVLFITCADSRIDPSLITQTVPGQLFICRNAGNIVPPHSSFTGGITASIEYAVSVLGIKDIIVCGHSDCGAMKAALNTDSLSDLPHVKAWLNHSRSAVETIKARCSCTGSNNPGTAEELHMLTEENILQQLQHLRTHPSVAAKIATGELNLHGWLYDIRTGNMLCNSEESRTFTPL